jgi:hypothetical protein
VETVTITATETVKATETVRATATVTKGPDAQPTKPTVTQPAQAGTIQEGTWTVGEDIEPGTYKTTQAVNAQCYWSITRTGTNGADIIENEIVSGGYPRVTLNTGQDFKTEDCGTWAKVG